MEIWLIIPREDNVVENWYKGSVSNIYLISVTCLVGFIHCVPQWINLELIFSTICGQSYDVEVFNDMGIPRYQNDDHLSTKENWKNLEIACNTSSDEFRSIIQHFLWLIVHQGRNIWLVKPICDNHRGTSKQEGIVCKLRMVQILDFTCYL